MCDKSALADDDCLLPVYFRTMGRARRVQFSGALYHVTTRGNWRRRIFRDDRDRELFLSLLGQVVERYEWTCHAYCLMDNHYHLLVQTPAGNLAEGMRALNGRYARAFLFRHEKSGHLFGRRYHPVLIERHEHLLEVERYVVLNCVRARLSTSAGEWAWSSYRATAGLARRPRFLTTDWTLGVFGGSRERFAAFVAEGSPFASLEGLLGA
jgi:putative transposase